MRAVTDPSLHPLPKLERLIRSPLGALTQSSWVDPMALFALRRLFFPLSRMWAAAGMAGESIPDFVEFSGLAPGRARRERLIARLLQRSGEIRATATATENAWREALFEAPVRDGAQLAAIEAARLDAAHRATLDRLSYYPLLWNGNTNGHTRNFSPVRWSVWNSYCCPPQFARTIAGLGRWAYSVSTNTVWVHLYGGSTLRADLPGRGRVELEQTTDYPWSGQVRFVWKTAPDG